MQVIYKVVKHNNVSKEIIFRNSGQLRNGGYQHIGLPTHSETPRRIISLLVFQYKAGYYIKPQTLNCLHMENYEWIEIRREVTPGENDEFIVSKIIVEREKKTAVKLSKKDWIDYGFRAAGLLSIVVTVVLFYKQQTIQNEKTKREFQIQVFSSVSTELNNLITLPPESKGYDISKRKLAYILQPELLLVSVDSTQRLFADVKMLVNLYNDNLIKINVLIDDIGHKSFDDKGFLTNSAAKDPVAVINEDLPLRTNLFNLIAILQACKVGVSFQSSRAATEMMPASPLLQKIAGIALDRLDSANSAGDNYAILQNKPLNLIQLNKINGAINAVANSTYQEFIRLRPSFKKCLEITIDRLNDEMVQANLKMLKS